MTTPTASSSARQAATTFLVTRSENVSRQTDQLEAIMLRAFADLLRAAQVREALAYSAERLEFYKDCISGDTLEGQVTQMGIDRNNSALAALDSMMTKP